MAEGSLGGILGEETETPEVEAPEAVASAEAFAAAVAAIASRQDPQVARDTSAFLQEHSALLKVQKNHLEDEHAIRLHHLRGQAREGDIRRVGLRLRVAFQVFLALVATVFGAGFVVALHDAFASSGVVVEPFDAPPALAASGLTGKVVAAGLLDELMRLQNATRTSAAKRNLSNAWTNEIKLAVPEAGISVSEIARLLKERFGHDLHIDGELVQTETPGLELTVRGDGVSAKSFAGASGDLKKLTIAAAEYVYSQSEPALWASYLSNTGRYAEAITFSRAEFASADKSDRPYLLNFWATSLVSSGGSPTEALALYRAALKIKPDFWTGYSNVSQTLWHLGDEEGAWRVENDLLKVAGGRPGRVPERFYGNLDTLTWNLAAWRDSLVAEAETTGGIGSANSSVGPSLADVDARLHDAASAQLELETTRPVEQDPTIAAISHFVRGRLAAEAGDSQRAASEMEAFAIANTDPDVRANFPGYSCWVALAEEAAGHPDKADTVLETGGTFVDCYRFRADILDGRGDWGGAQKAYAKAVALAPDLPAAYYSWGVALARHEDLAGAEAKFKEANRHGPHWADPLKNWGDVLVKQGRGEDALAKYNEALEYAPHWAALKEAREAIARHRT
jgi:tetratricopeptide (TPR) repeat protein